MADISVPMMMPRSASAVSRKQARRFWGAMGAAMRQTARWNDHGGHARADVIFRAHVGFDGNDIHVLRAR